MILLSFSLNVAAQAIIYGKYQMEPMLDLC
jgi:hypothetical protein